MSKTYKIITLAILLLALAAGLICIVCNRVVVRAMMSDFSYEADMEYYEAQYQQILEMIPDGLDAEEITDSDADDSLHYHNTVPSETNSVEDVIELAKMECTIHYNTIEYAYDEEVDMWHVLFFYESRIPFIDILGGGQSVYIRGDGVTQMIIYGK